jgi:hypothetical protein
VYSRQGSQQWETDSSLHWLETVDGTTRMLDLRCLTRKYTRETRTCRSVDGARCRTYDVHAPKWRSDPVGQRASRIVAVVDSMNRLTRGY